MKPDINCKKCGRVGTCVIYDYPNFFLKWCVNCWEQEMIWKK